MPFKKVLLTFFCVALFCVASACITSVPAAPATKASVKISILMYHHFTSGEGQSETLSAADFEAQIKALSEKGYTGVSLSQLVNFVNDKESLPEKPIVITLDDGYMSNYQIAYPILQKYDMKATMFVIGSSVGKSTYRDTNQPIIPHFGYAQAREMVAAGLISIQSHTYDMHLYPPLEKIGCRQGVLQLQDESKDTYIRNFREDYQRSKNDLELEIGLPSFAFSYPYGLSSPESAAALQEMGVQVTLTTASGSNTLIQGAPESLFNLKRYDAASGITVAELLATIENT